MLGEIFLSWPYVSVALGYGSTSSVTGGACRKHPSPSCALLKNTEEELWRIKILNPKDREKWSWQGAVIGVGG